MPPMSDVEWSEPLVPPVSDPAMEADVRRVFGWDRTAFRYGAAWVRRACIGLMASAPRHVPRPLAMQAMLVASQESSCRSCFGAARAYLRFMGLSEAEIGRLERDAQMIGIDEDRRALLTFCRNLARARPLPARSELDALVARRFSRPRVVETAVIVGATIWSNRHATLHAVPLDPYAEVGEVKGLGRMMVMMKMMKSMLMGRPGSGPSARPTPRPRRSSRPTRRSPASWRKDRRRRSTLVAALHDAFASSVLPRRTKALFFAVVARAVGSWLCEAASDGVLEGEGVPSDARRRVLDALSGPELDAVETHLLPWARETAFYRTEVIQRRTRELRDQIGVEAVTEAIGLAALTNALARIAMLEEWWPPPGSSRPQPSCSAPRSPSRSPSRCGGGTRSGAPSPAPRTTSPGSSSRSAASPAPKSSSA